MTTGLNCPCRCSSRPEMSTVRRIVIGLDRSPESAAALAWAAADGVPGADSLHIVHAYPGLACSEAAGARADRVDANDQRRVAARQLVDTTVRSLCETRPGLHVDGSAIAGDPVAVLSDRSRRADLVVIGGVSAGSEPARGPGRRIGAQVADRAACPVVVVPDGPKPVSDLPVVVLLAGGDLPRSAVDFAFAEADRNPTSVLLTQPWALGLAGEPEQRDEVTAWEIERHEALGIALATWQERYPTVPILVQLRCESDYAATRELHRIARLIVVAREPARTTFCASSWLALHRPSCPVAIIPPVDTTRPTVEHVANLASGPL